MAGRPPQVSTSSIVKKFILEFDENSVVPAREIQKFVGKIDKIILELWRAQMLLHRILRDRRANIAPIFALAALPIVGFIGMAVDYSRQNSTRAAMMAALDATGLILSKEALTLTPDQLKDRAKTLFLANFNRTDVRNVDVTPVFTELDNGSFKVTLKGHAIVDTTFARAINQHEMPVNATTEVVWGYRKLELALALDNTGSMAQSGKITELKKSVHNLLGTLQKAAKKPEDIKVAIIPFDTTVRIDMDYKAPESWLSSSSKKTKNNWDGCIEDRDQDNDVLDTTPVVAKASTLFPGVVCSNSGGLVKMLPLTSDWAALNARVDQMNPNGNTNVTIGLIWAWHALTGNLPFTQATPPAPDLDKVIILLTDGDNTQNRWSTSGSSIDKRTQAACANIKAANIKIYTIRVIDGNADLLKNCASNAGSYYDVKEASQLGDVFSRIAKSLASLRLAK
jgi:Flp pilus assembly protein TadG